MAPNIQTTEVTLTSRSLLLFGDCHKKSSLRSPQQHVATETTEVLTLFQNHFLLLRGWGLQKSGSKGSRIFRT